MNFSIDIAGTSIGFVEIYTVVIFLISLFLLVSLIISTNQKKTLSQKKHLLEIKCVKLSSQIDGERRHHNEKMQILTNARTEMSLQFKTLAQDIFDEKSAQFNSQSNANISHMLAPLTKDILDFKTNINEIYLGQSKDQASLKQEIHHLKDLNLQMGKETANLTKALRSDKKLQGDWGELILERALEMSGLRRGIEFDTQASFRNHDKDIFRPDAIIHLPDNKEIIVDSKVSLNNWQRAMAAESSKEEREFIKLLSSDVKNHIKGLSNKNYHNLEGINSLDFVLLFMPIETAFAAVANYDQDLISYALKEKIIITTPTTLLATLKTIDSIWRSHQQEQNSKLIAKRASLMLDKFRLYLEDMEKLGKQLNSCQKSYEGAINKLSQGRGNLVSQAEQLKELGVQSKKEMPGSISSNT
ncbi:MAG: DNA recombination protein RmuC [Desulfotalea sp.]